MQSWLVISLQENNGYLLNNDLALLHKGSIQETVNNANAAFFFLHKRGESYKRSNSRQSFLTHNNGG